MGPRQTFKSTIEDFQTNLWRYHLPVDEKIAELFIAGENRRVNITLNGHITWQAALMKSKSYWFILVNQERMDQLQLKTGMPVQVILEKDHSAYGHEMPEELQVLLEQDDEGNRYFSALTKGKQRSLVYIVSRVKHSDSRLNKALAIIHHLKEVRGQLDFKKLNETIKHYNNREKPGMY
jgi:hypothetical protein